MQSNCQNGKHYAVLSVVQNVQIRIAERCDQIIQNDDPILCQCARAKLEELAPDTMEGLHKLIVKAVVNICAKRLAKQFTPGVLNGTEQMKPVPTIPLGVAIPWATEAEMERFTVKRSPLFRDDHCPGRRCDMRFPHDQGKPDDNNSWYLKDIQAPQKTEHERMLDFFAKDQRRGK